MQSDYQIKLEPSDVHVHTFDDILTATETLLKPELLNEFRIYLTTTKFKQYNIDDAIQEVCCMQFAVIKYDYYFAFLDNTRRFCYNEKGK